MPPPIRKRALDSAQSPTTSRSLDVRLAAPAVAAWGSAALLLGATGATAARCIAGFVLLGLVAVLVRRPWSTLAASACVAAAAGALAALLASPAERAAPLGRLAQHHADVRVRLEIRSDPQLRAGRVRGQLRGPDEYVVSARVLDVVDHGRLVTLRAPVTVVATSRSWARLVPSQHVVVDGRLAAARNRGEPPLLVARRPPREVSAPSLVQRWAARLRDGLRQACAGLPSDVRGLVPGLVVGDVSALPPDLVDDFRTTGLTHLVAVSGANLAIVAGAVVGLVRSLGGRRRAVTVAGVGAILAFVVLARPSPSVLRSAVMALFAIAALASGRRRAGLPALAASVLLLILFDPALARAPGFALSVFATAGLLLVAPGWARQLRRHMPRWLAAAIAVPAAAQACCAPIILMLSGRVSLVAVPANVLAAPAVAPATVLGVLAAVTAPVALPIAHVLAWGAAVPAEWLVVIARHGAALPYAAVHWLAGWTGAVLLAVVTIGVIGALRTMTGRRVVSAAAVSIVVVVAVAHFTFDRWPPRGWQWASCDVGQGDASVIRVGPQSAVVVDAGPDPKLIHRCLRSLGVRRIPLVVLTHFHADHVEGLPGVLQTAHVGELDVGPLPEPAEERSRVLQWAQHAGVAVRAARLGDRWQFGAVSLQVIGPVYVMHGTDSDPNNDSIVMTVRFGAFVVLVASEPQPPAQEALLSTGADVRADVLKVPHHGSAFQDPTFFAATHASVAIVSVGAGNPYGHPAPETMRLLRSDGMRAYRTDRDGSVAIVPRDGRLEVVSRRGSGELPLVALVLALPLGRHMRSWRS